MADIESVRLPDASTFNIKDPTALHGTDGIDALADVSAPAPSNEDLLIYDGSTSKWTAKENPVNAVTNVYGAKQMLKLTPLSTTVDGVGITIDDREVVTTSGVASADMWYALKTIRLTKGKYILSGSPVGATSSTKCLYAYNRTPPMSIYYDLGSGVEIDVTTEDDYTIVLYVANGQSAAGDTYYPMIRDARILDPTFVPYAETNLQLTKKTSGQSNENLLINPFFTVNERGATSGATGIYTPANRWELSYGSGGVTWSRTADTITMQSTTGLSNAYLIQKMKQALYNFLGGKMVTISVMLGNYTIITGTTIFKNDQTFSAELAVDGQGNRTICTVVSSTRNFTITQEKTAITLRAVKLELGSVSTLANDVEPNQTLETLKCQKADFSQIAYQNLDATTARKAYNAGQYFFNADGELCRAIAAISAGGTLTENTNYIKTTLGTEMGDVIAEDILPDNYYYNSTTKFKFMRIGRIVYVQGRALDATLPTGDSVIFTALPEKFRPYTNIENRGLSDTNNTSDLFSLFIYSSTGALNIYRHSKNTSNAVNALAISFSYIARN